MKHSILILAMLFLISSCNNDEDGLITENATVYYYYLDPGFGGSFCEYVIETESHRTLVPKGYEHGLEKLFPNYTDHTSKAKITYRITEVKEIKPGYKPCLHGDGIGISLNPVVFIEVICFVKIK